MPELPQSIIRESSYHPRITHITSRRFGIGWRWIGLVVAMFALQSAPSQAQDFTLVFGTEDAGIEKKIETWGLDTAWLNTENVRRGVEFMGKPQVDVIRFSFTGDWPLVAGTLGTEAQAEFDQRMQLVNTYTESDTALYLNNDTGSPHASFISGSGVNAGAWAQLIDVTRQKCVAAGRTVLSVAPFNEPDYSTWQGDVNRFGDVCWQLRNTYSANFNGIRIMGANTLNNGVARSWGYDQLNTWGYMEEGNTHQLSGDMWSYIDFYQTVQANGDVGTNDELHNVMEAMVGAEYGMDGGIWWGTAERARGEFVKASDGDRLAYAQHRPNWTAASVYRAPDGKIQAFVGQSERQSNTGTYRFVSRDRPVFYDGHGPQHVYTVATTGNGAYSMDPAVQPSSETVVNVTWGDDVQPVIDGRYIIVAKHSGKVLDVNAASTADGANVQQWAYFGNANQQWDVQPVPSTTGGDYSYFTIRAAHSGRVLDLANFSFNEGGNVQQYGTAINVAVRQWFLEYAGDGWFYIRSKWSGKYLEVDGASTANGANVRQFSLYTPNPSHQKWRFMPVDADPTDGTPPAQPTGLVASANAASVQLSWNPNGETDLAGYTVLRSATSGGPYEIIARGLTSTSFTDNTANQTTPYYYVVKATDKSLNRSMNSAQASATPSGAQSLVAHWPFDDDLADATVNSNNATISGATNYALGRVGTGSLVLDGSNYLNLPPEVANFGAVTIAAWVYWNGGADWQRLFDFGNGTGEYMYFSPRAGGGGMRFAITSGGGEQGVNFGSDLPIGQWTHVAVTLDGTTGRLYVNGSEVNSAPVSIRPSDFKPVVNSVGRSQFEDNVFTPYVVDPDPLFSGRVDDFRIYNYALPVGEIGTLANADDLIARLKFNETSGTTAVDSTGYGRNATLVNGATWVAGKIGNAVNFAKASQQYATLPDGVVSGFTDFTISTWVKVPTSPAQWERIFDFGTSTPPNETQGKYMFLSVSNGSVPRFAITTSGWGSEQGINADSPATPLTPGQWYHIAVTRTGNTGRLYVNGTQVGSNPSMTLTPVDLGITTRNYLGRSQYGGDPYLNGALDDFRIYSRAMAPTEIAQFTPPITAPQNLVATSAPSSINLTWNAVANASSYTVKSSTSSGGPFNTTLASGLTATNFAHTLPYNTTRYYVVTATNVTDESSNSNVAGATAGSPDISQTELNSPVFHLTTDGNGNTSGTATVPNSVVGHSYQLQFRASINTGSWTNVGSAVNGTGSTLNFTITPQPGQPKGFYRILIQRL